MIRSANELMNKVRERAAQVVSIDLFDTLVYRTVLEPNDIFRQQFRRASDVLEAFCSDAQAWTDQRKSAEARLAASVSPGEVHLQDIYEDLARTMRLNTRMAAYLHQLELDLELEAIRPYQDVADALAQLQATGCRVVVCTDTYLPESFIRPLVASILPFDHVLMCSSSTQVTKRAGTAFSELLRRFAGQRIVHFGDNERVDQRQARRSGVEGYQTLWPRQHWLQSQSTYTRYARELGALSLHTPAGCGERSDSLKPGSDLDFAELAWRWSHVLLDFMLDLRRYAIDQKATDIWFLSRDCESIHQALKSATGFLGDMHVRYVPCSRAAAYPLVAQTQPDRFSSWAGRKPTPQDLQAGQTAAAFYRALLRPESQRVIVVDMGWKGRLQHALSTTLAPSVQVLGYYFSMEPKAEAASREQSRTFLPWSQQVFNQAVVESLAGFELASCTGFTVRESGQIEPVFRESSGDVSPAPYCGPLRDSLARMLAATGASTAAMVNLIDIRTAAVQAICAFPDDVVARCFASWDVGISLDGTNPTSLIQAQGMTATQRALGLGGARNAWPQGAIWSVSRYRVVIRLLQALLHARRKWSARVKERFPGRQPRVTN